MGLYGPLSLSISLAIYISVVVNTIKVNNILSTKGNVQLCRKH